VEAGEQRRHVPDGEQREVDSEHDDRIGVRHLGQAGGDGGYWAAGGSRFDREAHPVDRCRAGGADHHELVAVGTSRGQDAVEHGRAVDLDHGLVDATQAPGPAAGQHQCRSHPRRIAPVDTPVGFPTRNRAASPAPADGPLVDTFGRAHTDLRISVTDRCNFRCSYCMPAEDMTWLPREGILSYEEIERVARVLRGLGVTAVRLTGGEPLVRADLAVLVAKLAALGFDDLSLTTNGVGLPHLAGALATAGLRRVNVSCDSLDRDRFASITRRDALPAVLEGMDAAEAAGLSPVKVNVVLMRGVNDDEVVD